jgi:protein O-GlcNAc transferase
MNLEEQIFKDALAALSQHKTSEAERLFQKLIKIQPEHVAALNLLTVILMSMERFAEAEEFIERAVKLNENSEISFYNYGIILKRLGKATQAKLQFDKALHLNSKVYETWNNRGTVFNELMQFDQAVSDFDKAISLNPNHSYAFCNKGKSLIGLKRFEEASAAYGKALELKPDFAEAWLGRGNVSAEFKRYDDALAAYDKALELKPDFAEVWLGRGRVFATLKRHDDALAAYDKALELKPDFAEAWLGRGNVSAEFKRYDDALAAYDKALELKPDFAEAWLGRGNVSAELKRYNDAFAAYDKVLELKPDFAEAWLGRGGVFAELRRYDDALAAYDKALELKPDFAEVWAGRGGVFAELKRYNDAFAAYDKALELKPDFAEAWLGRGNVFAGLNHYNDAFAAYDKALDLKPEFAEAWGSRGGMFAEFKRYNDALAAYDKALELKPDLMGIEAARLDAKMHLCEWSNFDAECAHLISSIEKGAVSQPFILLAVSQSPEVQFQSAKLLGKKIYPAPEKPLRQIKHYNHNRIRVAYLSADFGEHPICWLLAGLFEQHNRKRFETFAISFEDHNPSEILTRLKGSFDQFIDVKNRSDTDLAQLLHALEVDIAVDLMGYTNKSRTSIFALRPSPIQVNYLGYPGTMGTNYIDYIIADRFVIPDMQQHFYSEKIIYLPNTFQANDSKRTSGKTPASRSEVGLPEDSFVFCSFNSSYKITPIRFDIWMRLLRQIDGSVLWLLGGDSYLEGNLRKEAESRGVNPARLIFAPRIKYENYLARFRLADLFLDTYPFNAGTTASDALWAGLPIVTYSGEAFVSRMAGSLLNAVGLPELITQTPQEYEELAIELATNPKKLAAIKQKLSQNRLTEPLFNTQLFTHHVEAAYTAIYERYQVGLPPDNIYVPG